MLIQLLVLLLIAGVCGALGQAIGGYSHGGCLVSIALGFIGALLGTWLAGALHLPELISIPAGDMRFPVIWSIIAAISSIVGFFCPRSRIKPWINSAISRSIGNKPRERNMLLNDSTIKASIDW